MFDEGLHAYLRRSGDALEAAAAAVPEAAMEAAVEACCAALGKGLPLLVCGNGGSAADAMHVTGELVGRFLLERRALKRLLADIAVHDAAGFAALATQAKGANSAARTVTA